MRPDEVFERAREAARFLRGNLEEAPSVALILGTGWDVLVEGCRSGPEVSFDSIPGFGTVGVPGHAGCFSVLRAGSGILLIQRGRLHRYEGYSPLEVAFPVFTMAELGVRSLFMFSAAGALNQAMTPGKVMVVRDHISLWGENPLTGVPAAGGRSPHFDTTGLYEEQLQDLLEESLPESGYCGRGVYAYVPGPSYETAAECAMLLSSGADVVGMSTVPEALVAGYLGLKVAAACCISNNVPAPPGMKLTHGAVLETVRRTVGSLGGLPLALIEKAVMIV